MHRGARQSPVFEDDAHCVLFLDTVGETVDQFGFEVHAWSLMPNHYHLLVRTPLGNLSRCMRHLNATYTQRLNRIHDWDGPLFRGRFHSQLVTDERYLRYLIAYIHLNPVRARLVNRPDDECWSSHRALVGVELPLPWLDRGAVQMCFGKGEALHEFTRALHMGRERWPKDLSLDFGWIARGKEQQDDKLVERPVHQSPLTPEELIERVVAVTGVSQDELRHTPVGRGANPARRFAVWMLGRLPTTTHPEIGQLLGMTTKQVANVLYRLRTRETPKELRRWREAIEDLDDDVKDLDPESEGQK